MAKRGRPPKVRVDEPDRFQAPSMVDDAPLIDVADGREPVNGERARKAWQTRRSAPVAPFAPPPAPPAPSFDPAIVDVLYGAISGVVATVLLRAGCSERVAKAATLTGDDLAALRGPTVAMLEKYAPIGSYGVEWAFGLAVVGVAAAKWMIVQALMAEDAKAKEAA